MFGLDETFLSVRASLRALVVCSLLIFAHVLLVTMAVAPRELMETFPELSRAVKILSGLTFLTLLSKVFLLFELADPKQPVAQSGSIALEESGQAAKAETGEEAGSVYSMTASELIIGTITLIGWTYCLSSAMTAFEILSARVVKELALLPITFTLAFGSLILSHLQLLAQLYRLRSTRAAGSKLWTVRTGHWETRVKLVDGSAEKV